MDSLAVPPLWVDFVAYVAVCAAVAFTWNARHPHLPILAQFVTTSLALVSVYQFYSVYNTWDVEQLTGPADRVTRSLSLLAIGYMLVDCVFIVLRLRASTRDKVMYFVHHVATVWCLLPVVLGDNDGPITLLFLSCEVTNILLNGREFFARGGLLRTVIDGVFALSFMAYRMGVLIPRLVLWLWQFALAHGVTAFGMRHTGSAILLALHFWWAYLIALEIGAVVGLVSPASTGAPAAAKAPRSKNGATGRARS